jgi:hypothetical protein
LEVLNGHRILLKHWVYSLDKEECQKRNWEKKIEEMKNQFTAWGKRNLTIMGKLLIIKALILQ